jgi:signal transduction histidine kinase
VITERNTRIFEPFFTSWGDGAPFTSTGLGLPVVKSIVSEHGGVVIVAPTASSVGARFSVRLPVQRMTCAP